MSKSMGDRKVMSFTDLRNLLSSIAFLDMSVLDIVVEAERRFGKRDKIGKPGRR